VNEQSLAGLRVLDLADERGIVAGKILSDLGADVLKVEPPEGDPARRRGPFLADRPDGDGSLFWQAYATGRRGITLALDRPAGAALLRRLIPRFEVLIESAGPGVVGGWGLGYDHLVNLNPRLIYAAINAFGGEGPLARAAAPDLVPWAMGGMMQISGDADRPPVRISLPQSYLHAGAEAAAGVLMALAEQRRSGCGQRVDVSAQECVVWTLMNAQQTWDISHINPERGGAVRPWRTETGTVQIRSTFACADGYVNLYARYGPASAPSMRGLARWIIEEGEAPDWFPGVAWEQFNMLRITQAEIDPIEGAFGRFFARRTKAELHEGAVAHRVVLMPVNTVQDIYASPQLAARDYWCDIPGPRGSTLRHPGPFAKLSATPIPPYRPAPRPGADNEAVYLGALGLSRRELAALRAQGVI
jgi:crotonobetainyl-CoA:carnitine CoA-transferase CaiB-like acyl-CoA transferase